MTPPSPSDKGLREAVTDLLLNAGCGDSNECEAIADAILSLPALSVPEGWRPIETAPKDGTDVLLFCPRGDGAPGSAHRVTCGQWHSDPGGVHEYRDAQGRWIDQDEREGFEGWLSWDGGFSEDTMMPTHWQPLPAPPLSAIPSPGGEGTPPAAASGRHDP